MPKKRNGHTNLTGDMWIKMAVGNATSLSDQLSTFENSIISRPHQMRLKKSGYPKFKNGIVERLVIKNLESGIFCENLGHQGSTCSVKLENCFCDICSTSGPPTKSKHDKYKGMSLTPIPNTCPTLFIILASRSSSGEHVPNTLYSKLLETLLDSYWTIQLFLKKKYDKLFQIHVIDECAINGSILATLNDCYLRVNGLSGEDLRLPGNMMEHVFQYHFSEDSLIAYMTNSPGELTGKFANHAKNLFGLLQGGIQPKNVLFMSHGITIGKDIENHFGVLQNFVIFNGEDFLMKIKELIESKSDAVAISTENTVSGYMSALVQETGSRLFRDFNCRKIQAGFQYPKV